MTVGEVCKFCAVMTSRPETGSVAGALYVMRIWPLPLVVKDAAVEVSCVAPTKAVPPTDKGGARPIEPNDSQTAMAGCGTPTAEAVTVTAPLRSAPVRRRDRGRRKDVLVNACGRSEAERPDGSGSNRCEQGDRDDQSLTNHVTSPPGSGPRRPRFQQG